MPRDQPRDVAFPFSTKVHWNREIRHRMPQTDRTLAVSLRVRSNWLIRTWPYCALRGFSISTIIFFQSTTTPIILTPSLFAQTTKTQHTIVNQETAQLEPLTTSLFKCCKNTCKLTSSVRIIACPAGWP